MHKEKVQKLIEIAREKMKRSTDPIHDVDHVERVVALTEKMSKDLSLSEEQHAALILAAWWHDASRTLTRRTSLVWMPLIDDTVSACMLWWATIKCGLFGSVAGMATRIIFSKSMGTGVLFTHLLMRKKNRFMIDILNDADIIDLIHIGRTKQIYDIVDSGMIYRRGYKVAMWWFIMKRKFKIKTAVGKKYLLQVMERFVAFLKEHHVYMWHINHYGKRWVDKLIKSTEEFARALASPA